MNLHFDPHKFTSQGFRSLLMFLTCSLITVAPAWADEWVFPIGHPEQEPNGAFNDGYGGWTVTQHFLTNGNNHLGTDFDHTTSGSEEAHKLVRAVARGRVIYSGESTSWGKCIIIRHDVLRANRFVFSLYGHLSSTKTGAEFDRIVYAGQPIGVVGRTGNVYSSSGGDPTHLHLTIFTRDNGDSLWDEITCNNILGYDHTHSPSAIPEDHQNREMISDDRFGRRVHYYDPITFIKFARLAGISPPSIRRYSVNGDSSSSSPANLRVGVNTVEVDVAAFIHEFDLSFEVRSYTGSVSNKSVDIINRDVSGWIMSNSYRGLGSDVEDGGWNAEYLITYRLRFVLDEQDNAANLALFWKPKNYNSNKLILPVPAGTAHNTVVNAGRYVQRTVR